MSRHNQNCVRPNGFYPPLTIYYYIPTTYYLPTNEMGIKTPNFMSNLYQRQIVHRRRVYVPWGSGHYVNASFQPEIMRLQVDWTVRAIVGNGKWDAAYRIANEMKWIYSTIYGKAFPVATNSVAIEIIGHVLPDTLATVLGITSNNPLVKIATNEVTAHTGVIDIGTEKAGDSNRWLWDSLSSIAWWLGSTY